MIKPTQRATLDVKHLPPQLSQLPDSRGLPPDGPESWANTTEVLGQEANSNTPAIVADVSVPIQLTLSHQGTSCNMALSALASP